MGGRWRFVRRTLGGVLLFSLLATGSDSSDASAEPPLETLEYDIRAGSWEAHLEQGRAFAEAIDKAASKMNVRKQTFGVGYYELGKVFETHLGHHALTFLFYRRAGLYVKDERPKNTSRILADIAAREADLARRKFAALRELTEPQTVRPSSNIVVVPKDNIDFAITASVCEGEDGRLVPGGAETYEWLDLFEPDELETFGALADIIGKRYLDGSMGCPSECNCWSRPLGRARAVLLSPDGYDVIATHEEHSDLTIRGFKSDFRNWWTGAPGGIKNEDIRIVTDWRYEPEPTAQRLYSFDERLTEFDTFLTDFPEYAERAQPLVDDLLFASAAERDTRVAYQEYLATFPEGKHTWDALKGLERTTFAYVVSERSIGAVEEFLSQFPSSQFESAAREQLDRLRYEEVTGEGDIATLVEFLDQYPRTEFGAEIHAEIDRLRFLEVDETNTTAGYQAFIDTYPESAFLEQARASIEAIRAGEQFLLVRRRNTRSSFEDFLGRFPNSRFQAEAEAMIAFFQAKSSGSLADCEAFLAAYRYVRVRSVVDAERDAVLKTVAEIAMDSEDAGAFIILHRELGSEEHLAGALSRMRNAEQEGYVFEQLEPEVLGRLFVLAGTDAEPNAAVDGSFVFANPIARVKPTLYAKIRSAARYAEFEVKVRMTLRVAYSRRWRAIAWFEPGGSGGASRDWEEEFFAEATVGVPPQGESEWVPFEFDSFLLSRQTGVVGIFGTVTEGDVVGEELEIVSVELVQ